MTVTGLPSLSLQLTRARFAAREGESLLYLASIAAYTVASALALTVAGGTWMFYTRWQEPYGVLAEAVALDPTFEQVSMFYFVLALFACALVIPSVMTLASGAAVLGARGRERRLAALRLLGLSSGDVTRMSLIDTVLQALIGTVLGFVIYAVTVPLWTNLEFQALPILVSEMWAPWWLLLAVCLAVPLIGLIATFWGLRQVRISPLGVARRTNKPALRVWRVVAFVSLIAVAFVVLNSLQLGRDVVAYLVIAVVMFAVIQGLNIIGPWLLQMEARAVAHWPWAGTMWAARRVASNPRQTWGRVSSLGLLALIAGYVSTMPIQLGDGGHAALTDFAAATRWDFTKGVLITLAVGLALAATSILITQASAVFERAEQSRALHRMGAPRSFLTRVMWLETIAPVAVSLLLGYGLGFGLAYPMVRFASQFGFDVPLSGALVMGGVIIAGLVLASAAVAACLPLQRQILDDHRRAND